MQSLITRPHLTSWYAIPVLILAGVLFNQHTIEIQVYDTYYLISNINFALAGSLLLLLIGFGYWLIGRIRKNLNPTLTTIHLLLTFGVLIGFTLPVTDHLVSSGWLIYSLAAFLIGELLYAINVFVALFFGTTDPPKL